MFVNSAEAAVAVEQQQQPNDLEASSNSAAGTSKETATLLTTKERGPGGSLDEQLSNNRETPKFVHAILYGVGFLALGLVIAGLGPVLLELGLLTNTDLTKMSAIFTSRAFGYLLGSIVGGIFFDIMDGNVLLSASLFFSGSLTIFYSQGGFFCDTCILLDST